MLCLKRAARLNFGKRARLGARIADSLRGSARAPTHAAVSTQTGLLDALIIPRRVATPVRPGGGGARPLGDQEQAPTIRYVIAASAEPNLILGAGRSRSLMADWHRTSRGRACRRLPRAPCVRLAEAWRASGLRELQGQDSVLFARDACPQPSQRPTLDPVSFSIA